MSKKTAKSAAPQPSLPPLGAHMSVSGGVDKALDRARSVGCTAVQIFLKNNNQWRGKALEDSVIERFRTEVAKGDLGRPIAHASYLVNLATIKEDLREKSMENLLDDLGRAETLGVPGIVLHPGAHMGEGCDAGIQSIARQLNLLFELTPDNPVQFYLETTAGQGSCVGHLFEHLRDIINLIEDKRRIGVCLDTCHVFAAGYDVRTAEGVAETLNQFDAIVGLANLRALHINDSKKGLGTRVDRHEHIGKGCIGEEGFSALMRETRLHHIPFILETPKGDDCAEDLVNLATLRRLAGLSI